MIFLLVANIVTIIVFWIGMKKDRAAAQQPSAYIIKELSFNENQQEQYMQMVKQHRAQARQIQEQVRTIKDSFFDLLGSKNIDHTLRNNLASKISSLNRELDLVTFDHFKDLRKICTPDQQRKFDKIIKDVLRMMGGPGPGRHADRPPRGDDMPPPPPPHGPPHDSD